MYKENINKAIILTVAGTIVIALGLGYGLIKTGKALEASAGDNLSLKNALSVNKIRMEQLDVALEEKDNDIKRLNKELFELAYPARLKNALSNAQDTIKRINKETAVLKKEKRKLGSMNISLKTRVQNSSKETSRLLKEIDALRKGISAVDRQAPEPSNAKISTKLKRELIRKEKDLKLLKRQFDKLQENYSQSSAERDKLYKELKQIQKEYRSRRNFQDVRESELKILENKLKKAEGEKKRFKNELDKAIKSKHRLEDEVDSAKREKEKAIEELRTKRPLAEVAASGRMDSLRGRIIIQQERLDRVTTLYDRLKEQLKEVSQIVSRREEELHGRDREIDILRDEVSYFKLKVSNLNNILREAKKNQDILVGKLSELNNLNDVLRERLAEVSGLMSKGNLPDSLLTEDFAIAGPYPKDKREQIIKLYPEKEEKEETRVRELKKRVEVILQSSEE